jgi:hypothetical protein
LKSKRFFAAIVFLAGSTACSDPDNSTPTQPAEEATEATSASQPTLPSSPVLHSTLQLSSSFSKTPSAAQQDFTPPMYAMNDRVPPQDVLVWKHDWEFDQADESVESTLFGASLNAIGDVNGDGYDDFAVGGWENDVDVYIFLGGSSGLGTSADMQIPTPQLGSHFGFSIASAGDVNGDGYDDMIIGAPSYSPSREDGGSGDADAGGDAGGGDPPTEGAAYLFMGSSAGVDSNPAATWVGETETSNLGYSVNSAGDINRDGFGDVAIGVPFAPSADGAPQTGRVDLYPGSGDGIDDSTSRVVINAPDTGIAFGFSVSGVGDTDGDDFDDLLVGAIGFSDGEQFEGGAFLFSGSQNGLGETPSWTAAGANVQEAYFGFRVDGAGDIDNDGFNDVVIGAPRYTSDPDDETQALEGAVFVYMGSENGLEADFDWQVESNRLEGLLGSDISGGHDVNGDGFDDLLVADAHFGHVSFGGELYLGGPDGLKDDFDWQAQYEGNSTIGDTARFVGDVDGDGFADMVLGAPALNAVYLYYGAPCFDADWDGFNGYNETMCPQGDDCHDLHESANPDGTEICDDLDNNCDGTFDEGCDDDGDGYCDDDMNAWVPSGPPAICPNGLSDCDDEDPDHNPGSPELCNFKDDDCNGDIDEEPKACGDQVCVQGTCFDECTSDANCAEGEACYDGRCAADPCAGIECPERREECFMGSCQVACEIEAECRWDDKQCIDGRCAADPCEGVVCPSEQLCNAEGQCEGDQDDDTISDGEDNCPQTPNTEQGDIDGDGTGDACDDDIDGDGVANDDDNCPQAANAEQLDTDEDDAGDACDTDSDGDDVDDEEDNCPLIENPDQADRDSNDIGDACDEKPPEEDSGGCTAAPGSVPPSAVMVFLATLGGLMWRRRS